MSIFQTYSENNLKGSSCCLPHKNFCLLRFSPRESGRHLNWNHHLATTPPATYDDQDGWVPTDTELALELAEQERLRAEQERLRADRAAEQLRQVVRNLLQSGMSLEQAAALTGLSPEQVQEME